MPTTPQPLDFWFTTPIGEGRRLRDVRDGPGLGEKLLGTRRPVKVGGTIDGHPFTATLMPSGQGPHWLPIKAALCTLMGKNRAGEHVSFRLSERFS